MKMSDLSYAEVRALISRLSGGENFIGIPRPLIALVGDHVAALVLNQALFYMKDADAEGWVNRSHEDWHADIFVSAYQLRRAFDALAPFGMETRLKKVGRGPTLHFRVDSETFIKKLREHFASNSVSKETKQTRPIVKKLDNQETSQTISDAVNEETRLTRNLTLDSEETSETLDKDKSSEESLKTTKSHSRVEAASTPPPKKVSTAEQVREVFDYWREVLEHPHAILDDKRKRHIGGRLREGASVDFIKQAIRGIKRSKFHMGQNDRHKVYDGLHIICKDADHLEEFAALDVVKIKLERNESPPRACLFCEDGTETIVDSKTGADIQVPCSRCGGRKAVAR